MGDGIIIMHVPTCILTFSPHSVLPETHGVAWIGRILYTSVSHRSVVSEREGTVLRQNS